MITNAEVINKIYELRNMISLLKDPNYNNETFLLWIDVDKELENIEKKISK